MCTLCGLLGGSQHWSEASGSNVPARQQRLKKTAYANRLLARYRLSLDDFHGQSYILRGPTGRTEMINDFSDLWRVVELMLGYPLDPLSPDLFPVEAAR
jgi:hypothetical protein